MVALTCPFHTLFGHCVGITERLYMGMGCGYSKYIATLGQNRRRNLATITLVLEQPHP